MILNLCLTFVVRSERFWRSKNQKKTYSEARHINLSLHFLEQVIVTLSNSMNATHVPYRNSTMTSILSDSLGGNCCTAMIANIVLNTQCISVSLDIKSRNQLPSEPLTVSWYSLGIHINVPFRSKSSNS